MKRILTLFSILSFAACVPKDTTTELTIGTYGGHLYRYSFDSQTLEFTLKGSAEALNASYALTYGDNIFAVSEAGAGSGAYSFRETEGTGIGMTADLRQTGADPCFLMVRKDSNGSDYLMTADYSGGSVSVFPIHDGRLEDLTEQLRFEGSGPVTERQEASHIHQLKAVPGAEGYILASDLGADAIRVIRAREDGKLEHVKDIACPEGSGPRHMEFNAEGSMMYCIAELSGEVLSYKVTYTADVPEFTLLQRIQADEVNAGGSADIHMHPSGKWLYTSHRLENDGISIFCVRHDGTLEKTGYAHTGRHPRNFMITPDGEFLLAACRDDRVIQVFRIGKDGQLTLTPGKLELESDMPSSITA